MVNYLGELGFSRQPGSSYKVARNGLATYDESWIGTPNGNIVFSQGNTSVSYPNTVLLEWTVANHDGSRIKVDFHYEGKDSSGTTATTADRVVDSATSNAPVETHPDFGTIAANGSGIEILLTKDQAAIIFPSGAVFEAVSKRFLYFTTFLPDAKGDPDFSQINPKAGIQNYKQPRATYTEGLIETSWPSMDSLGYIDVPPGSPPAPPSGKNWILDKVRVRNIANTYFEIQRVWMLSGPRGWDPDFYTL